MLIDLTLKITPKMVATAQGNEQKALVGHLGTHFDVMNQEFPLVYTERTGIIFDVSQVTGRDIDLQDIDLNKIQQDMFVAFYTGFIETVGYGNQVYFKEHPQLSNALIEALLEKKISIIGVDFAGIRRGKEHTPMDQYCAAHNVFVVENLCHLHQLLQHNKPFTVCTYPMHYAEITGLPCRVIAKL